MLNHFLIRNLFFALAIILSFMAVQVGGFQTTFKLERVSNLPTKLSRLRDRDHLRHAKMLHPEPLDFPVRGSFYPYIDGFYYTEIELGSPPKNYSVLIDTGSDVLWLSCSLCKGCPTSNELQIPFEFYDASNSSTTSFISCSDRWCSLAVQSSVVGCSHSNNRCIYTVPYGDGSKTSGYYVRDLMHLNTDGVASSYSAYVTFGCSTHQNGSLANPHRGFDGLIGFGPNDMSVFAQLSSQGITPSVFSHCFIGNQSGGGRLVIGQIMEPNMVYTPLVPSTPYYSVNLQSISVNGRRLSIDPSTFTFSRNHGGTIMDSGTTLAFFPTKAFYPLVDAITESVSQSAERFFSDNNWCYIINSSISKIFPAVSLKFAGDAVMHLRPEDYLIQQPFVNGTKIWCIGFQKSLFSEMTILGELVLKDKLVVYDLGCQRIGWKNHDCSMSINASSASSCVRNRSVDSSGSIPVTRYRNLFLILIIVVSCYQNVKGM